MSIISFAVGADEEDIDMEPFERVDGPPPPQAHVSKKRKLDYQTGAPETKRLRPEDPVETETEPAAPESAGAQNAPLRRKLEIIKREDEFTGKSPPRALRESRLTLDLGQNVLGTYKNREGLPFDNAVYLRGLYNLDEIHQLTTGKGVEVYINEPGSLDINTQHPEIACNFNEVGEFQCFEGERKLLSDHATSVAGIVVSIAPDVKLKKETDQKFHEGMRIINLSMGLKSNNPAQHHESFTAAFAHSLIALTDRGVIVVKTTGNVNHEVHKGYVAMAKKHTKNRMILVGNATYNYYPDVKINHQSGYSTNKDDPMICAAGTNIIAPKGMDSYALMTGTSAAAPIVSGALALLMELIPEWKDRPEKYVELILKTADPDNTGKCGAGFLNIPRAVEQGLRERAG